MRLFSAQDGVGRAGLHAQRAADAPGLVDHGHRARALDARWPGRAAHRRRPVMARQPGDAFGAAGRAVVDAGLARGHGVGVRCAIGVAAARALRLRQRGVQPRREAAHAAGSARRLAGCRLGRRAALGVGQHRPLVEAGDEFAHLRVDHLAPAAAGEDAVVARALRPRCASGATWARSRTGRARRAVWPAPEMSSSSPSMVSRAVVVMSSGRTRSSSPSR